jgi:hypothetical protein
LRGGHRSQVSRLFRVTHIKERIEQTMVSRQPFYLLVFILFAAGVALMLHRHFTFDIPWLPKETRQIWSVEAKIEFDAVGDPILASLAIPSTQRGFTLLNQHAASPGYGLSFQEKSPGRRAEWSIRSAFGKQELYYKVDMLVDPFAIPASLDMSPEIQKPIYEEPYASIAIALLETAESRSADHYTLARELIKELLSEDQDAELLLQQQSVSQWAVGLLNLSNVPARVVKALKLEDGRRRQPLIEYIQVFKGDQYQLFDPLNAEQGQADNVLLWEYHSGVVLDIVGGHNSNTTFSMIEQELPVNAALARKYEAYDFLNFSIDSLPLEEQALFKGILLIPIGVLVVVILRILIGLKTSGTFMPVLIAMAFIQTSLLTGLVGFVLIVGLGLIIRSYLSHLNLLLVARISAVIIMVIGFIAIFAVVAYKAGLTEGMKITFFPMIILAWTIERMSILWEEEGPKQVAIQGGGSLLVAILAYLVMDNQYVRHIAFNFLGLQLILMALVLLLGNYTGYRLLELKRFKPLIDEESK